MKKIEDNLYECLNWDLKDHKASDFENDTVIYIRSKLTNEFVYIINLIKGEYSSFSFKSYLQDAKNMKKISYTAGNKKGFTPYYIYDFIHS